MDKNDNETKRIERGVKVLKKLHEYLPDHFPDAEQLGNNFQFKDLKGRVRFTIRGGGAIHTEYDSFTWSKIDFEVIVLHNFVMNFNGDPYQDFDLAGLPFRFLIQRFIKKYLGITSRVRLEEILDLLSVKGYAGYFSGEEGSFEDNQLDELIKDVFERKNKTEMTANSLAKWIGIKNLRLMEYLKTHQTDEIIYIPNKERVIYRKMSSDKEIQDE